MRTNDGLAEHILAQEDAEIARFLERARAASWDAGSRHARSHGRAAWDRSDYNAACREYERIVGVRP